MRGHAKDALATEPLETATYTAIRRLAGSVGDQNPATVATSIRAQERRCSTVCEEAPTLIEAVVRLT